MPPKKRPATSRNPFFSDRTRQLGGGLFLVFLAVLVFFADTTSTAGSIIEQGLTYLIGSAYRVVFSPIVGAVGILVLVGRIRLHFLRFLGLGLFWLSEASLAGMLTTEDTGMLDVHSMLVGWMGTVPTGVFLFGLVLFGLYGALSVPWIRIFSKIHKTIPNVNTVYRSFESVRAEYGSGDDEEVATKPKKEESYRDKMKKLDEHIATLQEKESSKTPPSKVEIAEKSAKSDKKEKEEKLEKIEKKIPILAKGKEKPVESTDEDIDVPTIDFSQWELPSTDLLAVIQQTAPLSDTEIETKKASIQKALLQFRIEVEMGGQKVGPTVIQYRLKPADGVKLSRIENLKKDLTLALKAKSIRIQAPIPGVGLVGIEVPNDKRETIGIREVLESSAFTQSRSPLPLAVGKDINGDYIVGDLTKMPHLLIAGQTGSGKSVGMNGFLISLLYRNSPETLRMIMVDPKRVELGVYNGIPHLLAPVINAPDKALNALRWGVGEMLRRYDLLQAARCRNLSEYNAKVDRKTRMPYIVIVIDELADLMMSGSKKDVEGNITRIAQMARAVGMHLVIATQRPSVDVITGLIKANVPSRIAFTVASAVDSRTILDRIGAEDLLGYGDMLYAPSGSMAPERIQ